MTRFFSRSAVLLALPMVLSACATATPPVEVTRFHAPETVGRLGRGVIAVVPASGGSASAFELATYRAAIARELARLGYVEAAPGIGASQIAEFRLDREVLRAASDRSPVSVGVGGSTGSYGSGVGVGVGINLGGGSPDRVETELAVTIRDVASRQSLWEGRAGFGAARNSRDAGTQAAANRIAAALFSAFPGRSGETIEVR